MRKIVKKRLIYYTPWTNDVFYGGEEYDINLPDFAILGAVHEVGKTMWLYEHDPFYAPELWLLRPHPSNPNVRLPQYRIEVEEFYTYVPTLLDRFLSFLR